MKIRSDIRRRARWFGYLAVSLAVHALLFAVFDAPERETVVTTITINESEVPPPPQEELEDFEELEVAELEEAEREPVDPDETPAVTPEPEALAEPPVVAVMEPPPAPVSPVVAEPQPEPESEPEPAPPENLRSVFQPDRDTEAPEQPSALAEVDNSTDVETMPEETVDWTEESGQNEDANDSDEPEDEALSELSPSENQEESESLEEEAAVEEIAAEESEEVARGSESGEADENIEAVEAVEAQEEEEAVEELAEVEEPDPSELAEGPGPVEPPSALDLFRPQHSIAVAERAAREGRLASAARGAEDGADRAAYDDVFGERDERDTERVAAEAREASLLGDHEAQWERTRRALENYDVSVTPGSELSLNTRSDEAAAYIHYLHDKIHDRWWAHLTQWDLHAGPTSPLSDYSLVVELEFGIRRDGEVEHVSIANGSGTVLFDGPAVGLLWDIGPHQPPPPGLIGSDGNAHVRWSFHRDNRGCISSGASVRRVQVSEGEGG